MDLLNTKKQKGQKWGCGCAVINDEGKFLLGLRCKKTDLPEWCFVGGSVEVGETPVEAIIREIKEESSLIAKDIEYVGYFVLNDVEDFIFMCKTFEGTPVPKEDELKELRWFSLEELKNIDIFPYTEEALKMIIK